MWHYTVVLHGWCTATCWWALWGQILHLSDPQSPTNYAIQEGVCDPWCNCPRTKKTLDINSFMFPLLYHTDACNTKVSPSMIPLWELLFTLVHWLSSEWLTILGVCSCLMLRSSLLSPGWRAIMQAHGIVSHTLLYFLSFVYIPLLHSWSPDQPHSIFTSISFSLSFSSKWGQEACCRLCYSHTCTIHDCGLWTADCAVLQPHTTPHCAVVTTDCGAVSLLV